MIKVEFKKMTSIGVLFAFILLALSVVPSGATATPIEQTTVLNDLPVGVVTPSDLAGNDGLIYVIGGDTISLNGIVAPYQTDQVIKYNPVDGNVDYGTPMPTAVGWASYAMAANGTMYVFGGWSWPSYTSGTQIYDPVTDSWSTGANAPVTLGGNQAVRYVNGTFLVIAWNSGTLLSYDPVANSWHTLTPCPNSIWTRAAVVVNDTAVLFMGGRLGGNAVPTVDVYNPVTDSWSTASDMLLPAAYGGATIGHSGYVYYIGGFYGGNWPDVASERYQIQRYDAATDTWDYATTSLSYSMAQFGIATDNWGRTFVVGGYDTAIRPYVQMLLSTDVEEINGIQIVSPTSGDIVSGVVSVTANLKVSWSGTAFVDFLVDGALKESLTMYWADNQVIFLWDTTGLIDASSHTLLVRAFNYDSSVAEDSVVVTVSAISTEQRIIDLESQISDLESQISDLQNILDEMNASTSQNMSEMLDQLQNLQNQLDDLSGDAQGANNSSSSANTMAMLAMILALIAVILIALNIILTMRKKS